MITERSKELQERGLSDYISVEEMHPTHIRRRMLKTRPSIGQSNFEENDKPTPIIVTTIVNPSVERAKTISEIVNIVKYKTISEEERR